MELFAPFAICFVFFAVRLFLFTVTQLSFYFAADPRGAAWVVAGIFVARFG